MRRFGRKIVGGLVNEVLQYLEDAFTEAISRTIVHYLGMWMRSRLRDVYNGLGGKVLTLDKEK